VLSVQINAERIDEVAEHSSNGKAMNKVQHLLLGFKSIYISCSDVFNFCLSLAYYNFSGSESELQNFISTFMPSPGVAGPTPLTFFWGDDPHVYISNFS